MELTDLVALHRNIDNVDFGDFCKIVAAYYGLIPETELKSIDNRLYKIGKYTNILRNLVQEKTVNSLIIPTTLSPLTKKLSPTDYLKEFAVLAEVPFRIKTDSGKSYTVRAYSKEAAKALMEFMRNRNYDIAVNATKLYYKSNLYHKTLTNFILQGDLENYYDEIVAQAKNNNLQQFVKKELQLKTSKEIEL